jgi:uncharacterized membrane protein YdbT with pleckstrin-like domain
MLKSHLFPTQQPDEKILILKRRHWLIAGFIIIRYAFFLLAPLILYVLVFNLLPLITDRLTQSLYSGPIAILALSLYYLLVWVLFFHAWLDYYLDVWIVTNTRIVNIIQNGLFSRSIAEAKLYRLQDVQAEVHGLLPTFFHYGNITIQTAGNETFAIFEQVPSPYETSREILKLAEYEKKHHHLENEEQLPSATIEQRPKTDNHNNTYYGA